MVTIRDIAQAAGVSPMTVSNVLNKRPHVADATRAKVLATIDRLDYRVNVAARNLRRGRTHTIGLAVPEIDRPYFGQLSAAVIAEGARHDLNVVIEQTGRDRENELNALAASRVRLYDGLILSAVGLGNADRDVLRVDYPVVVLGERIFDGPVDHVAMPNTDGADAAVEHLLSRGCRRVVAVLGGVGGPDADVSSLRFDGYRRALSRRGIEFDPQLLVEIDELTPHHGQEALAHLLRSGVPFDGVFCVTDYVALGALRALSEAGVEVPRDVKVIGFDDIEMSQYLVPSLSTVNPDHDAIARTAVEMLVARIDDSAHAVREVVSPFRLVARESTAPDSGGH